MRTMRWFTFLSLVALASALTRDEKTSMGLYYKDHPRVCGDKHFVIIGNSGPNITIKTSGIPAHTAYRTSAFRATSKSLDYIFPDNPQPLDNPLCVPVGVPIGFALDGVPFYSALTNDWNNAVEGSCSETFDGCHGNVDSRNQYFYREKPNFGSTCLGLEPKGDVTFIGVAIDGFPMYYDRQLNRSSLDECGGRYADPVNKRGYRYILGDKYPYTFGCFRGSVMNISTLTSCHGDDNHYGRLCTCVHEGAPGFALGYKWLRKEDVAAGESVRKPFVRERQRNLICNLNAHPEPEYLDEDKQHDTCVDFRSLHSLLVIQGHRGGLAPWTRLANYGREDHMYGVGKVETEHERHQKALRWLLADMKVLEWTENKEMLEKLHNETKRLMPREQRRLRDTLMQVWVISHLKEIYDMRPNASKFEKEVAKTDFRRMMWALRTLQTEGLTPYIRVLRSYAVDPYGVWVDEHWEELNEEPESETRLSALTSQLTALQLISEKNRYIGDLRGNQNGDEDDAELKMLRQTVFDLMYDLQRLSDQVYWNEGRSSYDGRSSYAVQGREGEVRPQNNYPEGQVRQSQTSNVQGQANVRVASSNTPTTDGRYYSEADYWYSETSGQGMDGRNTCPPPREICRNQDGLEVPCPQPDRPANEGRAGNGNAGRMDGRSGNDNTERMEGRSGNDNTRRMEGRSGNDNTGGMEGRSEGPGSGPMDQNGNNAQEGRYYVRIGDVFYPVESSEVPRDVRNNNEGSRMEGNAGQEQGGCNGMRSPQMNEENREAQSSNTEQDASLDRIYRLVRYAPLVDDLRPPTNPRNNRG